jgi:16S rRNA (cytidine1402-2'-O)-methyltransferase
MQEFFNGANFEPLEPALYVLATPIGNLKDITLRALEVLKSCDIIFCEDTRVSKKLLTLYNINENKRFFTYNNYSEDATRENIFNLINKGNPVVLMSDAGTPLISDPGFKLVKFFKENNVKVIPIGGISAGITALSCSGISSDKFEFFGFLPAKNKEKSEKLQEILEKNNSVICYESPNRLLDTLEMIKNIDSERTVCVAREITKKFESIITATANYLYNYYFNNQNELKGEVVLIIEKSAEIKKLDLNNLEATLRESLKYMSVKDSSEFLSSVLKINRKELYKILLTFNGK